MPKLMAASGKKNGVDISSNSHRYVRYKYGKFADTTYTKEEVYRMWGVRPPTSCYNTIQVPSWIQQECPGLPTYLAEMYGPPIRKNTKSCSRFIPSQAANPEKRTHAHEKLEEERKKMDIRKGSKCFEENRNQN